MADYKIDQIKAQYPQYAALSDEELGQKLHAKFYSDMPYGEFENRMGIAEKRKEAMYDELVGEMGIGERMLVGAGKAFVDVGTGVKQLAMMGGNALGLVDDQAVEAYRQELAAEDAMYEELTDRSSAATVGNIGTNVGMFFIPGGALAKAGNAGKLANAGRVGKWAQNTWDSGKAGKAALGALYGATETATTMPALSQDYWGEKADQAGLGALFGAGGELAGELVSRGVKHFTKGKEASQDAVDAYLRQNGIDVEQLSNEYRQGIRDQINAKLNAGADDVTAAIEGVQDARLQRGDDFVPMTGAERKGILDGDYEGWALQKEAEMGAHGSDAQKQVVGFERMRDGVLADNVTRQFSDLGPLDKITDLQAPAAQFTQGIEQAVDNAKRTKSAAYDAVNPTGMGGTPDTYLDALSQIRDGFGGTIKLSSKAETPNAYALYKEIDSLITGTAEQADEVLPGALSAPGPKYHSLADFESLRRRINAAIGASEKQDKALLYQVKRNYDQWFDQAVDGGRFIGDEANYAALKNARAANADYMSIVEGTYKDGKPTVRTKLVQDIVNGKATPENIVNQLMGATGTKQNARAINDLKQLLGSDSAEFGALKQAGYLNVFGKALEQTDDGLQLKRGNYARSILDKVKSNRTTLEALYGKTEVERWVSFANDLKRIQPDLKTLNPSGTSYSQKRMTNRFGGEVAEFLLDRISGIPLAGRMAGGVLGEAMEKSRNRSVFELMRQGGMVSADFTTARDIPDALRAIISSSSRETGRQTERTGGILAQ